MLLRPIELRIRLRL